MPDEALTYSTVEEQQKALEAFDETKGSQEDLERIMNAKIEPKEKTADASAAPSPDASHAETPKPPEKTAATPIPAQTPAPAPATPATDVQKWAADLGFNSFEDAKKAFTELKEKTEAQQRYLQEHIERPTPAPAPAAGANAPAPSQKEVAKQESKISVIRDAMTASLTKRKALAEELRLDSSLITDPEYVNKKIAADAEADTLGMQMLDEMQALRSMLDANAKNIQDMTALAEANRLREQSAEMFNREMDEIDEFSVNPKHPEFSFTEGKTAREVESEYIAWANRVASAVYGGQINMMRSKEEREAVAAALSLLNDKDPKALDACRATGAAAEPSEDIRKYLDICELLDHRDGLKINPVTGVKEQQTRYARDPATGAIQKVPVRFATLEDAYAHRMATDGTFEKKIKSSYVKGTQDMAAAAARRAAAPAEMGNAGGAKATDVGVALTAQDAMKILAEIDEQEAERRRLAGDPGLSNKLEEAMALLGAPQKK